MNRLVKKWLTALLAGGLLAGLLMLPAGAEILTEKTYTLIVEGENGQIVSSPDVPAFWEYPLLSAGQGATGGTLTFVNEDKGAVDLKLKAVTLPYDDPQALAYLDALRIRVSRGNTVLYDGPYSRIAEKNGLVIEEKDVPRGGKRSFTIDLFCSFAYEEDPATVTAAVEWSFTASPSTAADTPSASGQSTWVLVAMSVAAGLVILCGIVGALNLTQKRRNRKA